MDRDTSSMGLNSVWMHCQSLICLLADTSYCIGIFPWILNKLVELLEGESVAYNPAKWFMTSKRCHPNSAHRQQSLTAADEKEVNKTPWLMNTFTPAYRWALRPCAHCVYCLRFDAGVICHRA